MPSQIPSQLTRYITDRRALLWVCQGYDLIDHEEPHDYDLLSAEAALKYRQDLNHTDRTIGGFYWEALWLEGADSPILRALREGEKAARPDGQRPLVVLAAAEDAKAKVSSEEFLTACVLPGLIDPSAPPNAQYGAVRSRIRGRIAWELGARLSSYQNRMLVVLGAKQQKDLVRLYEVLEDSPIANLAVLVVWPEQAPIPQPPANRAIHLTVFRGIADDLCQALREVGAPGAGVLPEWSIRVGQHSVSLSARDIHRVLKRFAVITERDLAPPNKFELDDLQDFLRGSLDNWAAYGVGLPVARSYRSQEGLTFIHEMERAFTLFKMDNANIRTFVLQLPCEPGGGATTMLRAAAYEAAKLGHPALLLRPEQVDIDFEDLLAFTTALSEAALIRGIESVPAFIIVVDAEQSDLRSIKLLPQQLAAHGRTAVILQTLSLDSSHNREIRRSRMARLSPLLAVANPEEIEQCQLVFTKIARAWDLPIEIPSLGQWRAYDKATQWTTPGATSQTTSMFWVALRFFLTEGMTLTDAQRAKDALGNWIEKRMVKVEDSRMKQLITYVAALSSFRIVCPLWTVLRPLTGGEYSSDLSEAIQQTEGIVVWGAFSEDLSDQVLLFAHPTLADEYLRRAGISTSSDRLKLLGPLLSNLSAGSIGDIWLAEVLVASVLAPAYEERYSGDWEWRLSAFDKIPPAIREQSKTILHHWGRCLYLSALDPRSTPPVDISTQGSRLRLAIDKLKKTTEIERRPGRDEHPSHLFNTLGTAYSRYATFLEQTAGDRAAASEAWSNACKAFEQALATLPGANVEALLAFSRRLLTHARASDGINTVPSQEGANEIAYALSLLDEAEEVLKDHPNPEPQWEDQLVSYRAEGLGWLSSKLAQDFVRKLQDSESPELGYYCEARLALNDIDTAGGRQKALAVFAKADNKGIKLGHRALALRISLVRQDPVLGRDFALLRNLHRQLEADPSYIRRPIDLFRYAVLCYQTGDYAEGAERFARLREHARRSSLFPLSARDTWRSKEDPSRPRITQVRVTRITTEWRAEGYVDDLNQTVVLRPRHFSPPTREREIVNCVIRFEASGPIAVPPRFEERAISSGPRRQPTSS